jgi:hypothetical protein
MIVVVVEVVRAHPKTSDRREGMESAHAGARNHRGGGTGAYPEHATAEVVQKERKPECATAEVV